MGISKLTMHITISEHGLLEIFLHCKEVNALVLQLVTIVGFGAS
jgi:hypothetical protein